MPALNMKLPAQTAGQVNDSDKGQAVICNPFSGPKGSPFDRDAPGNYSTGALSTGIGFGANHVLGAISDSGFTDDYTPGVTLPSGSAATKATLIAIGGGHSSAAADGIAATVPYDVQPLLNFGQGASRDAGSSLPYSGHGSKLVTATGTVANGSAVETGYYNRTGASIVSGQSVFGMASANSNAVTPNYLVPVRTSGSLTPTVSAPATAVATYAASGSTGVVWSIYGGANSALFAIDSSTGALTFVSASSAGSYVVVIQATDAAGNLNRWEVDVTVS